MGRKPIGRKAMTATQRQRRRRKKLKKDTLALGYKALREMRVLKAAKDYMPMPRGPSIIYWDKVIVQTAEGEREVWAPRERPWASVPTELLTDDDIRDLASQLAEEANRRGIKL